jgi:hypothetical protein
MFMSGTSGHVIICRHPHLVTNLLAELVGSGLVGQDTIAKAGGKDQEPGVASPKRFGRAEVSLFVERGEFRLQKGFMTDQQLQEVKDLYGELTERSPQTAIAQPAVIEFLKYSITWTSVPSGSLRDTMRGVISEEGDVS